MVGMACRGGGMHVAPFRVRTVEVGTSTGAGTPPECRTAQAARARSGRTGTRPPRSMTGGMAGTRHGGTAQCIGVDRS